VTEKKPTLKIALTGASCTGKTTLLENCKQLYKDRSEITFVDESARAYFKTHPVPVRFSAETQLEIQNFTLTNEKNAHDKKPLIILTDSSTVDQVVYTKALGAPESAEKLFENITNWVSTYDKFLMMNPDEVPFENDDIRTESYQQRQKVHQTFIEIFDAKKIPYEIISGTPEERLQKVDSIITNYTTNS
jgi:nicotinamide riboside kinase